MLSTTRQANNARYVPPIVNHASSKVLPIILNAELAITLGSWMQITSNADLNAQLTKHIASSCSNVEVAQLVNILIQTINAQVAPLTVLLVNLLIEFFNAQIALQMPLSTPQDSFVELLATIPLYTTGLQILVSTATLTNS